MVHQLIVKYYEIVLTEISPRLLSVSPPLDGVVIQQRLLHGDHAAHGVDRELALVVSGENLVADVAVFAPRRVAVDCLHLEIIPQSREFRVHETLGTDKSGGRLSKGPNSGSRNRII